VKDFVVPESDDSKSISLDDFSALGVLSLSLVVSMGVPIEFDHKTGAEANEVPDVVTKGMLPSELVAAELSTA